jgi:hypothetical protein
MHTSTHTHTHNPKNATPAPTLHRNSQAEDSLQWQQQAMTHWPLGIQPSSCMMALQRSLSFGTV